MKGCNLRCTHFFINELYHLNHLGPRAEGPRAQGRGFPWSKQAPPTETKDPVAQWQAIGLPGQLQASYSI
jgi:hypothetical protein